MKICVLTHNEALLLERDGKKPLCFDPELGRSPHRHISQNDLKCTNFGTAFVLRGQHQNLEIRFIDDNHRRAVWIESREWRIVGQTKYKPVSKDSRKFMQPGSPCYNLVPA